MFHPAVVFTVDLSQSLLSSMFNNGTITGFLLSQSDLAIVRVTCVHRYRWHENRTKGFVGRNVIVSISGVTLGFSGSLFYLRYINGNLCQKMKNHLPIDQLWQMSL